MLFYCVVVAAVVFGACVLSCSLILCIFLPFFILCILYIFIGHSVHCFWLLFLVAFGIMVSENDG